MAVGTDVGFDGNAVPLTGDFEAVGRVAATDHVTLTAVASATGKQVVVRSSTGTEWFSIGKDGNIIVTNPTAATVPLKVTEAASQTGKAIVVESSANAEKFSIGPDGALKITSSAAGDALITAIQAATPTGLPLQIQNSSSSKIFHIATGGDIRTMVLKTVAIGSVASNASTSFSLAALTTDDAVLVIALKTPTTGNGILQAFAQGTTRVDVFAEGGSVAANTYAVWAFSTVSN